MSNLWAITYDYMIGVTPSDTVDDPNGKFSGLLCSVGGAVVIWPVSGPIGAYPLTIEMVAGQTLAVPIKRVGASTTATVFGLVSAIQRQGV